MKEKTMNEKLNEMEGSLDDYIKRRDAFEAVDRILDAYRAPQWVYDGVHGELFDIPGAKAPERLIASIEVDEKKLEKTVEKALAEREARKGTSEYDQKIEEAKQLCEWFDEHGGEVIAHDCGIVMAIVDGEPKEITAVVEGSTVSVVAILRELVQAFEAEYWKKKDGGESKQ